MLLDIFRFLFKTVSDLFLLVVLLRFYLQWVRAPFQHPLAQFVLSATNFVILPLRRYIPSIKGYDSASLLVALLVALFSSMVLLLLTPYPLDMTAPSTVLGMMFMALIEVFRSSVYLLMGAIVVQAVLSWVSAYNPLMPLLESLTRPFLQPFRRLNIGGVDLSPLVVLVLLQVVLIPVLWLEQRALTLVMTGF